MKAYHKANILECVAFAKHFTVEIVTMECQSPAANYLSYLGHLYSVKVAGSNKGEYIQLRQLDQLNQFEKRI